MAVEPAHKETRMFLQEKHFSFPTSTNILYYVLLLLRLKTTFSSQMASRNFRAHRNRASKCYFSKLYNLIELGNNLENRGRLWNLGITTIIKSRNCHNYEMIGSWGENLHLAAVLESCLFRRKIYKVRNNPFSGSR